MSNATIIGGEYRIDPGSVNKEGIIKSECRYSLGRTALYAIVKSIKNEINSILLPNYICNSIAEVIRRLDVSFMHYCIMDDFLPDVCNIDEKLQKNNGDNVAILLISYFGLVDLDQCIRSLRNKYPKLIIIVDDVQNYYGFGKHLSYDYCFTSYRKWFPVPDGADILQQGEKTIPTFEAEAQYVAYKIAGNLLKNYSELIGDSVPLELLDKGEHMMDKEYFYSGSSFARQSMHEEYIEKAKKNRMRNAEVLHRGLTELGIKHLYKTECTPLFIPIIINNRDEIRSKLFSCNIFTPIHWPVQDEILQGNNKLYESELSLICDQRYDEEDMLRILKGIENEM